jgi:hypothetical protein
MTTLINRERDVKHILVSMTCRGRLHWRLIAARREGKRWRISSASFQQFLDDVGQRGVHRISIL